MTGTARRPVADVSQVAGLTARLAALEAFVASYVQFPGVFGVAWDKGSNPVMTRTDSSIGRTATVAAYGTPAVNSFDGAPIFGEIYDVTDTLGNVFARIPKFYIAKTDGPSFHTVRISKTQYPGFYLPAVFRDFTTGRELDCYYHGKHKASLSAGSKLESKAGAYPLINKNIVDFRTYARANNAAGLLGYQQLDIHAQDVITTLFQVEFATLHSQSVMVGLTTAPYDTTHTATIAEAGVNRVVVATPKAAFFRVGQAVGVGTTLGGNQVFYGRTVTAITVFDASNTAIAFDGAAATIAVGNIIYSTGWRNGFAPASVSGFLTANDGRYPCSYRGIESPWGDVWQFVDGVNINERQAWVTANAENYASNVFAYPYTPLGYVNGAAEGYTKAMGFDVAAPFAEFPVTIGGSLATYYADYYYNQPGQRIARVGGYWYNGSDAGLSYWFLNNASSYASVALGGRLLMKPL